MDYLKVLHTGLVLVYKSGIFDINGVEICAGDTVELVISIINIRAPNVSKREVIFHKGAFRFKNDVEHFQSCIGDISHNCTMEVIEWKKK